MNLPDFEIIKFFEHLIQIVIVVALVLPIGWERETSTRIMGLRTFPLVAVASCGFVIVGIDLAGEDPTARARLIQGLMTGIGFIGGGALIKQGGSVRGTATAASVWATGAIGAAVAAERYEMAVILSMTNYAALRFLTPIEERLGTAEEEKGGDEGNGDEPDEEDEPRPPVE